MKIAEKKDYRPQVGDNDEENGLPLKAIVINKYLSIFSQQMLSGFQMKAQRFVKSK